MIRWLALAALILTTGRALADPPPSLLLFDSGKEGYKRYRIPSLVMTQKGTLLALCEGRKGGGGLTGAIDIVLKRSRDDGVTWGPLEVIASAGKDTLGNPCPVVDRKDGTIWLALTRSRGQDTEERIVAGLDEPTRVVLTFSRDDGRTWAPLRDISDSTRAPDWTWYGTGPGVGVQLQSGRLLIPSYHAERGSKIYRSHMIFSDDHGKTWQRGQSVGAMVSECQAAQRSDGTLVLSTRTMQGEPTRTIAFSKDEGASWSATRRDSSLHDPACQAHLYRLPGEGKTRWLYSHPAGPKGRRDLSVRYSDDEGQTWSAARLLRAGDGQYSCLAQLGADRIGCLYDAWVEGNYRVYFVRFHAAWLK